MAESERYQQGTALRRQLMGEAFAERMNQSIYTDPVMQKFREVTTETVFGTLWSRPGLDLKTRILVCGFLCRHRPRCGAGAAPAYGVRAGLDRGGTHRGAAAPDRLRRGTAHSGGYAHGESGIRGNTQRSGKVGMAET